MVTTIKMIFSYQDVSQVAGGILYGANRDPKLEVKLNLSTAATLGTEESGRCGEVAVMGR